MFYNLWLSPCGSFSIEARYIETIESDSAEQAIVDYGVRIYGGERARCLAPADDGVFVYSGFTKFTHYPATNWIGARDGITKAVPVNECLSCPSFSCMKK